MQGYKKIKSGISINKFEIEKIVYKDKKEE